MKFSRNVTVKFLFLFLSFFPVFVFSDDYDLDFSEAVTIPLPVRKKDAFFSSVDRSVMALFEDGSPESILAASAKIKKTDMKYSDVERILLYIADNLMKICWSSVDSRSIPKVSVSDLSRNPYVGAIDFAKDGIYDFSMGDSDIFCLILPSLALLSSSSSDVFFDKSETALLAASEKNPSSVLVNFLLGVLYSKSENYEKAAFYFERSKKSKCFEVSYRLAESYKLCGKFDKSFYLAESISISNQFLYDKVLRLCADSAFAMGNLSVAEEYVAKVLQREPDNRKYVLLRAHIFVLKGEYIHASALLDSYSKWDSASKEYLLLRARVQKEWNKNIMLSSFTLEKAVSLYPDDVDVMLAAARLCSESGVSVAGMKAGEFAKKILAIDPDNKDAVKIQVSDFVRKEEWDAAYNLSSSIMLDSSMSDLSEIYIHIDICLMLKKNEEAWMLASGLFNEDSDKDANIQSYLKVLIATSRKNDARKLISKHLAESSPKMKSFLFYQKSRLEVNETAIFEDLRASLASNPRNKDSLYRLYSIYYEKKEYRKAQFYLKQLVSIEPNDTKIQKMNENLDNIIKNGR